MLQIIRESLFFYRVNLNAIFIVFFPIYISGVAISRSLEFFIIGENSGIVVKWLPFSISLIAAAIYTAGLILLFSSILKGSPLSPKECIIKGLWYFPFCIVTDFIVMVLTLAGFLLLIVPGIILSVRLSLSQFFLLLLDDMPIKAIEHSLKKTKGFTNAILSTMFVLAIPLILIFILSSFIQSPANLYGRIVISLLTDIFTGFYTVLFLIVLFRYFCLINET